MCVHLFDLFLHTHTFSSLTCLIIPRPFQLFDLEKRFKQGYVHAHKYIAYAMSRTLVMRKTVLTLRALFAPPNSRSVCVCVGRARFLVFWFHFFSKHAWVCPSQYSSNKFFSCSLVVCVCVCVIFSSSSSYHVCPLCWSIEWPWLFSPSRSSDAIILMTWIWYPFQHTLFFQATTHTHTLSNMILYVCV